MAEEDAASLVGRRVGHYLVGDPIGSGSMGQVYRARDLFDGRPAALKLHRRRAEGQAVRRFVQEARALFAIEHPGVATVYDAGREGDLLWIALELCEGRTLSSVLEPGAIPWAEAVALLFPVVEAVASAHAAGVMHRDIKPANVIVASDGSAKLVDFGLAKRIGELPSAPEGGETVWDWADVHTAPGAVLGTPAYMSPEQARAQAVDARADVFALGVVLWEAIAGRALFRRATAAATIRAILTEAAPRLDALGHAPPSLAAVVACALENDPARRYPDARGLASALSAMTLPSQTSVRRTAEVPRFTPEAPPFFGRARELDLLSRALARRVRDIAVVGGPAMGKTRLVDEALALLGDVRVLRLADDQIPDARALEGARVVVVDPCRSGSERLRGVMAEVAPRASLVRVAARWAAVDAEQVIEVGPLAEDVAEVALTSVDADLGRRLVRAVGGHPLGIVALADALARGESGAALLGTLAVEDAWPAAFGAITGALDASLARVGPALDDLRVVALLGAVDAGLAAALSGTNEHDALRAVSALESWSLLDRRDAMNERSASRAAAGPGDWLAPAPLGRRRLLATNGRDARCDAALDRAVAHLAARADALVRALDERPAEGRPARAALVALAPLVHTCAVHALAVGSPPLLDAAIRLSAAVRRTQSGMAADARLAPLLAAGATLGVRGATLAHGHAALGTLEGARSARVLAREADDARASLEAALSCAQQCAAVGAADEASVSSDEARRFAEELGAPGSIARACLASADAAWARSDAPRARRELDQASLVAERAGDEARGAAAELARAQIALAMADQPGALPALERAELHALASGRARIAAIARCTLAELALLRGDVEAAREEIALAAAHARVLDERVGRVVLVAAQVELAQGRARRAADLARAARGSMTMRDGIGHAVALAVESVARTAEDRPVARALGAEALETARHAGRVEVAIVRAWLGSAPGAEPSTALDVLSLPPRATLWPGTSLALATRAVELGLSPRRSRWPEAF